MKKPGNAGLFLDTHHAKVQAANSAFIFFSALAST